MPIWACVKKRYKTEDHGKPCDGGRAHRRQRWVRADQPDNRPVELQFTQGRVRLSGVGIRLIAEQPARCEQLFSALIDASAVRGSSAISAPSSYKGTTTRDDMATRRRLEGHTIAALAADGFEKVE